MTNPISSFSSNTNITKSGESSFLQYLEQIKKFPLLTPEEEYKYAVDFVENNNKEAAKMLLQSHLRLVVKIAYKFKNYGLPVTDLVSEGNLGLIQAVKKFDPYKGFRFSTYAMWWIKAYIQEYILHSWSLVKIGTTVAQKKLFFNLHKIKKKLLGENQDSDNLSNENIAFIADSLNVSPKEVIEMNSRLSQGDTSLNNPISSEDDSKEAIELIADSAANQEEIAIDHQEKSRQKSLFYQAFNTLNEREQDILMRRQMSEDSSTLEDLSQIYKVSRERIRQIEEGAINKIKKEIARLIQNKKN